MAEGYEQFGPLKADTTEAVIEMELTAEESQWFCVRASRNGNYDALSGPDIAHSSAVYVRVNRKEVVRKATVQFWIENVKKHLDRVKQLGNFANDAQRLTLLEFERNTVDGFYYTVFGHEIGLQAIDR